MLTIQKIFLEINYILFILMNRVMGNLMFILLEDLYLILMKKLEN